MNILNQPGGTPYPQDGLTQQYDFYFKKNNLTRNMGFYGWKLSPNTGITDDQDLMRQYLNFSLE